MKYPKFEGPTFSLTAEGNREETRKTGECSTPLARSKALARIEMSIAREPGDLQLALPGMEPGEQLREPQQGARRRMGLEKSDRSVVPRKQANKARAAESVEGRELAKGNVVHGAPHRTQCRIMEGKTVVARLRQRANKAGPKEKFTNLLTHLRVDLFESVYNRLKRNAATGVDRVSWEEYGETLTERLSDLQRRVHHGGYRPSPVRRTYIPKGDGGMRPLGICTIEDKIVQGAVVSLLTPIYEAEFSEKSYAFGPGRNQHMALDAVEQMMYRGRVKWVLDIDIRSFFDSIDHDWLQRMLEVRIGDKRLVRLIGKWLKAGVFDAGELRGTEIGTPQGGLISPLLGNLYLHYVFDIWFESSRRDRRGLAHFVRYADDAIVGFENRYDAEMFRQRLEERLAKFGLEFHPGKTSLFRFGKFAQRNCHRDGRRKPANFDFLGFTHVSTTNRKGSFFLLRKTSKKKRKAKQAEIKREMKRRMHWKLPDQWKWLCSVLRGHYAYYGLRGNYRALKGFREWIWFSWQRRLQRRSQRAHMSRPQLNRLKQKFPLPKARILRRQRRLDLCLQT